MASTAVGLISGATLSFFSHNNRENHVAENREILMNDLIANIR